ncbi:hypothetical protein BDN70DRAFT_882575 [Pholiota conissans]|uniref:Altered inheritance of mitochondria protein 9, mitochondrial n=1 Tax=Pholiota conissans TaxID=109636 RepID=A0A9P5YV56_9AGAR|nr:hypothetical protein BDN70DRAFT_882575 [Pholiota conissans]
MLGIVSKVAQFLRPPKPSVVSFTLAQRTSFYKHTTDRWLYNEDAQNSCRYVEFNVEELQRVACNAVGAKRCIGFVKLDEGSYNKIFALNFDNGSEALVRIPSKLVRPPFFSTASEVATLEFAREVLDIPTPRVFAWNGHADRNSVGVEYIIMERMQGVGLLERWLDVSGKEAVPIFDDAIKLETAFEAAPFASIGSLYFKEDVSSELQSMPLFTENDPSQRDSPISQKLSWASKKYRIGPITDRQWWRGERLGMNTYRGPWPDFSSFLLGAIDLEHSWISQYAGQNNSPSHRKAPYYDPSVHLHTLDMYSQVIPHIVPPPQLCTPMLWHPDLSLSNLLVAPSGPSNIIGVIDWQDAVIAPYIILAQFPTMFAYEGERIYIPPGSAIPELPKEFPSFLPEEQEAYRLDLKLAMRQKFYEIYISRNKCRLEACRYPLGSQIAMLPYYLLRSWTDSPAALRQLLLDIRDEWDNIATPGAACPISFKDQEIKEHKVAYHRHNLYNRAVQKLNVELGCIGDGAVPPEKYADSMKKLNTLRDSWDEKENGGPFPYCDGMFSFFLN